MPRDKCSVRIFVPFSKPFCYGRVVDASIAQGPGNLEAGNPTSTNVGPRIYFSQLKRRQWLAKRYHFAAGASNLSAEQRRRLEARRVCERTIEANKMLETRLAHVILPLRMLCLLIFAVELLQQLDSHSNNYQHFSHSSWYVIMIPLWVSNVLKMIFHSVKLKLIYNAYKLYHRAYWENNAYRAHEMSLLISTAWRLATCI